MPFISPVLTDQSLVPAARLGAALHRARSRSGQTMAALARMSDGRFLPDDLVVIERGEAALDDSEVRSLVGMYALDARPWAHAASLSLIVDRTPTRPGVAPVTETELIDHEDIARWVGCRLVALSVLVGIDMASGRFGLDGLAEAIERPLASSVELVDDLLRTEAVTIGAMVEAMLDRLVVPEVGLLIAQTDIGSLLLVARSPLPSAGALVPACGTLFEQIDAAR